MTMLRSRLGFTLTEMMVALVLLTIGALGMAAFSATITQANRDSTNRTRADQALRQKLEELRTVEYDLVASGSDVVSVGGTVFSRSWTVAADTPVENLKRVELTSEWSEPTGDRDLNTTSLIARW